MASAHLSVLIRRTAAIDEEDVTRVLIEGQLRGLPEVGVGLVPRLQLLLGEAAQQIKPDKVGALRQAGAEQGPGLGRPLLPQEAERIEILRPEVAGTSCQHPVKLPDGLGKLLAAVELIGHQEMIENVVERRLARRLLGLFGLRRLAQQVQIARPFQMKRARGRSECLGMIEVTEGSLQ